MIGEFFNIAGVAKKVSELQPLPVNTSLPGKLVTKTVAFTGAAGLGATGTINLFTVTGDVLVRILGICKEDLVSAGGGTLEVGYAGATPALIAQTTATDIDNNEIWKDSTPDASMGDISALPNIPVVNGQDIIATVGTANITDGTITFCCFVTPLSTDATVVAA